MAAELLPDELIVEILSFLPAKSLLRFRLVCKCWLNLISSPTFKLMHLHSFNQLSPRYFARRLDYYESEELYNVHFDDEVFTFDDSTQIEFPLAPIRVNLCYRIVGCCNGVVCLSDDNYDDPGEDEFNLDAIILWNPSIRRKLTLPLPMSCSLGFENPYFVLGFGYDSISDDFKVVSLTYDASSNPTIHQVEVYTVKTGIWREVVFPDNLLCYFKYLDLLQVFSNGSMHWMAWDSTSKAYAIMTFDMSTELFGEIQLPKLLAQKHFLKVTVVGESLAVIHSSGFNFDGLKLGSTYMVMVMKEYKNPASWTLLYHMHYPEVDLGKPLQLRNNGDMIVELGNRDMIVELGNRDMIVELGNRDMIMFNHNEGSYVKVFADHVEEEDFDCRSYVDRYEESLALLDVGDSVPNKEAMEALMMIENQGNGLDSVAQHE